MRVVAFNFRKINVEKKSDSMKNAKIDSRLNIDTIEKVDSSMVSDNEIVLKIKFDYNIEYKEDLANIELKGNLLIVLDKKEGKKVIKSWKKKDLSEKFKLGIFNFILKRSNVKALSLEEDMGLPLHIPLPSLKKQNKKE